MSETLELREPALPEATGQLSLDLNIPVYDGSDITHFRTTLTVEGVYEILEAIENEPVVAVDTETTGLDYMRDHLHGISLATADKCWYVSEQQPVAQLIQGMIDLDSRKDILWVAHNSKYDIHFLAPKGFRPKRIADTLIAQWLVDENMELGLKSLAHTRLGLPADLPEYRDLLHEAKKRLKKKRLDEVSIYDIPIHILGEYSARDTRLTYDLWQKLLYDLEKEGQTDNFWNIEMPFIWVLLDMENTGLPINQAAVKELEYEWQREMIEALTQWNRLTNNVNPKSPKQLAKYLFEDLKLPGQGKTAKGAEKVDDLTLQRLEPMDPSGAIKILRHYKKLEKLMGTYVVPFQQLVIDGRLHGSFNQTGTVTGRLSSSDPNLQNIPSRGEMGKKIRKAFGLDEREASKYTMVVCDYSQIELRMLANKSKEPNFIQAFEENKDPHQLTADMAKVERSVGKAQPLDALVRTPEGWKRMGEIKVGDQVISSSGMPTQVLAVYPQGLRPIYQVTFNDGTSTECDEEHLWNVRSRIRYGWQTLTLKEIMNRGLYEGKGKICRFEVPLTAPVQLPEQTLPIHPYLLGVLLGNGCFRGSTIGLSINTEDAEEMVKKISELLPTDTVITQCATDYLWLLHKKANKYAPTPASLLTAIRDLGLWEKYSQEKHIPASYLLGSQEQRLSLLRGLMDTDGCVTKDQIIYSTTSSALRDGVIEIVQSLGGIARWRVGHPVGSNGAAHECYDVAIVLPNGINPFLMQRKGHKVRPFGRGNSRRIQSVEYVGEKDAQCILVEDKDHLYLTNSDIVTHNTLNFSWAYGAGPKKLADTIEKNGNPRPDVKDTRKWLDSFNAAYPTLVKWKNNVVKRARQLGYVPTITGRKRRLPDLNNWDDEGMRMAAERQCVNARIQGSCADMLKWAMLQLAPWCKLYGAQMAGQVHDEIVFLVPNETVDEFIPLVQTIMESIKGQFNLNVKIEAQPGHGKSWSEAK